MTMNLPARVSNALTRLRESGFPSFLVGGCVRDACMGLTPHDYDIAAPARPDEIQSVFAGFPIVETGVRHGTVTVLIDGLPLEITAFRTETGYSDGRHPDRVSFSASLPEDLARRDFTINAMAYSPEDGLIDPFGGRQDLAARRIRCVGDPRERFAEDALRILRALRFSACLGFMIAPETAAALRKQRETLLRISAERVTEELKKLLTGPSAEQILLAYPDVLATVIPELAPCIGYDQRNPHHEFDLLTHSVRTVSFLPPDPVLRLAGLLHDVGKPVCRVFDEAGIAHYPKHAQTGCAVAEALLSRLRLSRREILRITTLIRYHDGVIPPTEKAIRHRLNQLGPDLLADLLALQRADHAAQTEDPDHRAREDAQLFSVMHDVIRKSECYTVSQLAVNGHDMIDLGLSGPAIGRALAFLLDAVIRGETENERTALLRYLAEHPTRPGL